MSTEYFKNDRSLDKVEALLAAETPEGEAYFYPKAVVGSSNDHKALCVPYITRQFVEDRLDDVVGPFGWETGVREEAGVLCFGIGIRNFEVEGKPIVWKWDTGADTESMDANQSVTGGIKRAGRLWGIGRDISRLSSKWRPCRVRMVNGKAKFQAWESPPSLAELLQYTAYIRHQGKEGGGKSGGELDAGTKPKGEKAKAEPNGAGADSEGSVGGDAISQFWHLAKALLASGVMTQDQIDDVVKRHGQGDGRIDFDAAKAELDQQVPS